MLVRIDEREKKSRIKSAEKFFHKLGYPTNVETLVVGDYVFADRICFEYKSANDMIGSIKDGRVFRQARNMKQYDYSFVIVVGSVPKEINKQSKNAYWRKDVERFGYDNFTVKAWLGAYARLETYSNVLVVENDQQAWQLMDALSTKILKDNADVKMVDRPQNGLVNPIASYLSCIYVSDYQRLSTKVALNVVEYLEETGTSLLDLKKKDLLEISGIGKKTAVAILDAIGELKNGSCI